MIVRDEEAHIADCLKSARPYVDEMIVVDTGSRDRTAQIARSLGAKVIERQWQDSFSAARNVSLDNATGDWIFWMDADDVLPPDSGQELRRTVERAKESALGVVAQVRCPAGPGEFGETVVDHVKLFRNRPDLRFELRIHEQILPSIRRADGEIGQSGIEVVHAHYDTSPEGQRRKRERDRRLLELDLREHPDHPFVHFNIGMTAVHERDYERAIEHLRRSIELAEPHESHVRKTYALLASTHRARGDGLRALEVCREGRRIYPDDPELMFNEALAQQLMGRLPEAADTLRKLLARPTDRDYLASVDEGIASYKARHNLGAICREMGDHEEAEARWRQVIEEQPRFLPAWIALGDLLIEGGRGGEVEELAARAQGNADICTTHLLRGRLALQQKALEVAESHFLEVTELAPHLELGWRYLSHALLQSGERQGVEAVLRRLLALAPDDGEAHHNLASLLMETGRLVEAVPYYETAVRLRPDYLPSQQMLQEALAQLNKAGSRAGPAEQRS